MTLPPRTIHLDELESIPGPGSLTWHPVRATLGIRAFGCNAYTAANAGDDVVEAHSEDPTLAHQELYFVAAGRATFTIDDTQHDAPFGTYVFIPDPASHRHAVAAEPQTTVLSFGGPPTFEPSAWEWAFRAAPLMRTDPARSREILAEGLKARPDAATLHYNLACLEAIQGNRDPALAALRQAFEVLRDEARAELAASARDDEDFESLRNDPEFQALSSQWG
jgi:mannose-6-phosphate isomerase-like protein (cupin superfamily)